MDNTNPIEAGREARDRAVEAVAEAEAQRTPSFASAANAAVGELVRLGQRFTTDDVWEKLPEGAQPEEPRAMGAIMRSWALSGRVKSTGVYVQSRRPVCHVRPVVVWEPVPALPLPKVTP